MKHIPVLLDAVCKTLGDMRGMRIIDATFGAGGYSRAFLNAGASVVAYDRDPNALQDAAQLKSEFGARFEFIALPFANIANAVGNFDAIVFDLGISSMQIDNPLRGFSFRKDAPLDMRMSESGQTAAGFIENISDTDLARVLRDYGDVRYAGALAAKIKRAAPKTTFELRDLIGNPRDIAPVFQSIRIAVNDEFGQLRSALESVPSKLMVGGKCICVTFHSLEDRIVKNTFREWSAPVGDPRLPDICPPRFEMLRAITPSADEIAHNPRARSAHLRAVKKSY